MPPMKIDMMLHFFAVLEAYHNNQCKAYVRFVRELLSEGMIERTTEEEKARHPGWSYKATAKGDVYVEAVKSVPLPVELPASWIVPIIPLADVNIVLHP